MSGSKRGRKPQPAQAKILKGNFRPDRDSHGPVVEINLPPCPNWLPKKAKKHWSEIGKLLASSGLISIIDGDVFALHCDSVSKYEEVTQKLKSIDDCLDKTPQQYMVQSALFTVRSKLHEQIIKTADKFGLNPAARSSIKNPQQPQLPFEGSGWGNV